MEMQQVAGKTENFPLFVAVQRNIPGRVWWRRRRVLAPRRLGNRRNPGPSTKRRVSIRLHWRMLLVFLLTLLSVACCFWKRKTRENNGANCTTVEPWGVYVCVSASMDVCVPVNAKNSEVMERLEKGRDENYGTDR